MPPPPPPPQGFSEFYFLEDKTSSPDVFSRCSFIPRAHFESSGGQFLWLRDMTTQVGGGQAIFE